MRGVGRGEGGARQLGRDGHDDVEVVTTTGFGVLGDVLVSMAEMRRHSGCRRSRIYTDFDVPPDQWGTSIAAKHSKVSEMRDAFSIFPEPA